MAKKKRNSKKSVSAKKVSSPKKKGLDPIYVPFIGGEYKKGKVNLLHSKLRVISSTERVENLAKLREQKTKLFLELRKILNELLKSTDSFEKSLPTVNKRMDDVQVVSKRISFEKDFQVEKPKKISVDSSIDKELRAIQAKLDALA